MTQKQSLFKGKSTKKSIPPNRHGKAPHVRKGKRVVKPNKFTKEMDAEKGSPMAVLVWPPMTRGQPSISKGQASISRPAAWIKQDQLGSTGRRDLEHRPAGGEWTCSFNQQELTKFINHCNEIKAANIASKEGGDLNIVKPDGDQSKSK